MIQYIQGLENRENYNIIKKWSYVCLEDKFSTENR